MQVKSEVFSRFGNSVDFSSGEPLGGVEASTVGADLCVRPSSPERSLFCGRTRRSAPTQATSARQFHSSNAVALCRDARLGRPLYQRLQHSSFNGDGRTSRASLQIVTRHSVRCIKGYSVVVLTETDAPTVCVRAVRPYKSLLVTAIIHCGFDGDGRRRALI